MGDAPMPDATTLPEALAAILDQDLTMAQALARYASELQRLNPTVAQAYEAIVRRLRAADIGRSAPGVGDHLPDFVLTDQDGQLRTLRDFMAQGPIIVSLNRGHWCPFCRIELEALRKATAAINRQGAGIVSIMPEKQSFTKIVRERGVPFPILSDIDGAYSLELGLCYYVGDELVDLLRARGHGMPAFQGNDSWFLPVPATFVLNAQGKIMARHIDPDFRFNRMAIDQILSSIVDARA